MRPSPKHQPLKWKKDFPLGIEKMFFINGGHLLLLDCIFRRRLEAFLSRMTTSLDSWLKLLLFDDRLGLGRCK
jgi:hypothetical protein